MPLKKGSSNETIQENIRTLISQGYKSDRALSIALTYSEKNPDDMPAGRPTKYHPEMCQKLIDCGKEGYSVVEMACFIGIHKDTLYDWAKNNPEFSDSLKMAIQHSQDYWEKKGRAATFGEIEGFNPTAYIFQMKNRFREDYSDVNKHEVKTDNPLVIVTTQQPDGGKD